MTQTEKQEFHDEQGGHSIFSKNSRTIQEHFVTFQEHNEKCQSFDDSHCFPVWININQKTNI